MEEFSYSNGAQFFKLPNLCAIMYSVLSLHILNELLFVNSVPFGLHPDLQKYVLLCL